MTKSVIVFCRRLNRLTRKRAWSANDRGRATGSGHMQGEVMMGRFSPGSTELRSTVVDTVSCWAPGKNKACHGGGGGEGGGNSRTDQRRLGGVDHSAPPPPYDAILTARSKI